MVAVPRNSPAHGISASPGVNVPAGDGVEESVPVEGAGAVAGRVGEADSLSTKAIMEYAVEAVALTEDTTCVSTKTIARAAASMDRDARALLR